MKQLLAAAERAVTARLLPVTFYSNPSTRLDNVKNLWRFVISLREMSKQLSVAVIREVNA